MQRRPLTRKTPLRARPKTAVYERPEPPPMDLAAAAAALQHQAASAALPREFTPVEDVSQRGPKVTGAFSAVTREIILDRENHRCARCGASIEGPDGYSLQHRINRGQGGTSDPVIGRPSNGLTLCGDGVRGCHGWVERNPIPAERAGYAVQSWADPTTVPVRTWQGWRRLDDKGHAWIVAAPVLNDAHHAAQRRKETP